MAHPHTPAGDVVETLHGHEIADPYRWLEDPDSTETQEWVAVQNAHTRAHLEALPGHGAFSEMMRRIMLRPTAGTPLHAGDRYLVSRNDGTRPQPTVYVARSLAELEAGGEVLLDPSSWSDDGTTSLQGLAINDSGTLAVYGVSLAGSDEQLCRVLDLATGERVDEPDVVARFSALAWLGDDRTYVYNRYVFAGQSEPPRPQVRLHTVGTDPSTDRVVLELPDEPRVSIWPQVSSDRRWMMVSQRMGTESRNRLWVYRADGTDLVGPYRIVDDFDHEVTPVDVVDDVLFYVTDRDAERGRVLTVDLSGLTGGAEDATIPEPSEVLAERDGTLSETLIAGDVLVTTHLEDAAPVFRRWSTGGELLGRIDVGGGQLIGLDGDAGRDELLLTVSSVVSPSQAFHVVPSTGEIRDLSFVDDDREPPQVRVTRHHATSADGTHVPYWLLRREDAPAGPLPTLMYGYGGFNVPLGLWFSPTNIAWVESGGAVAVANLRGGGEFGAAWYDAGRLANKQNVFDDFAAVGHHLIDEGVTTRDQLAAYGGSNGGLLVGALITQHPDLIAAAAPMVGVLDLLRFHKFTIGSAWISDYGDPDVAEDFEIALAYSPLHNVRPGTHYPATIVVTGDHDDRVVPAHSHKFTATLQAAQGGQAPILTRVETSTGHGAGKPRAVAAQEIADVITFLGHHTGLTPPA